MLRRASDGAADRQYNSRVLQLNPLERVLTPDFQEPIGEKALQPAALSKTPFRRSVKSLHPPADAICLQNADPRALEQYRIVRTKIAYHPLEPKLIVVTSACTGDGKTISAANLATVFAFKSNVEVLLVDADLRRSCLADVLGVPTQPGVADVLSGKCDLNEAIVRLDRLPSLCVLPAGTSTANPAELLDTTAWQSMCNSLRQDFAFIFFDAPPVAAVADYELIEKNCDGVIMVVRPDRTDRSLFRMAHELVSQDKMLGVLMNGTNDWFLWKTPQSYYGYSRARA
jgi:non-specific protein-tyrosine kinase